VVTTEWFGLLAPAGTPQPIIAKLNAEIARIMKSPDLGERLTAIELGTSTPAELDAFIQAETRRWAPLIKSLNLTIE
jgi:tripartite-type tricarboxylate transporter receptor subunit TctC